MPEVTQVGNGSSLESKSPLQSTANSVLFLFSDNSENFFTKTEKWELT